MWLPHMFGRSMRGSHLETETCTLELRTCCLCEKRKDPGFFFIRGPFLDALGISHRTQGMHLKCIRCFRCISVLHAWWERVQRHFNLFRDLRMQCRFWVFGASIHVLGLCGVLRKHMSTLNLRLGTWTWACEFNLVGLVGTKRIVVPRLCTWEHMFLVMWRLRKWEETHFGTSLTLFWKTPSHHSWEDLDQGLFKAEVKLGKRKPFVCVSCFTQSGTGKIPENISKLARRQFSRDRSFTKDLAAKLRVWLKFASGKKSEADFEISQHG